MACKHCVSDGKCDLKKNRPVNCWYLDNAQEQNQCHFFKDDDVNIDLDDFEYSYTELEKYAWWVSLFIIVGVLLAGVILTIISVINGDITLTQGILFEIIILGTGYALTPVVKSMLKIFKMNKDK